MEDGYSKGRAGRFKCTNKTVYNSTPEIAALLLLRSPAWAILMPYFCFWVLLSCCYAWPPRDSLKIRMRLLWMITHGIQKEGCGYSSMDCRRIGIAKNSFALKSPSLKRNNFSLMVKAIKSSKTTLILLVTNCLLANEVLFIQLALFDHIEYIYGIHMQRGGWVWFL